VAVYLSCFSGLLRGRVHISQTGGGTAQICASLRNRLMSACIFKCKEYSESFHVSVLKYYNEIMHTL